VAYYQTDGANNLQIVCGDGSDTNPNGVAGKHNDGYYCTTSQSIVAWERQVWFFARLMESPRVRVFGIDAKIAPALRKKADELHGAGKITQTIRQRLDKHVVWGAAGGWAFHHHHAHLSFL
jgi:hypothetical protein